MPLGSLLGPSQSVLDGLGPQKTFKSINRFKVFANAGFGTLKLLMALLGPILAPSWADLVPKWIPKIAPKVVQKMSKNWSKQ